LSKAKHLQDIFEQQITVVKVNA